MSTAATKRRIGIISTVVVALVASLLVWMATRSEGEVVRKADLNDGGVWVTSTEQSRYGRINKAAAQLDLGILDESSNDSGLDVLQDGAAVLGLSKAGNQIMPIDPMAGTLAAEQAVGLPKASAATGNRVFTAPVVDLRGGTVALIDPATGTLKAQRVQSQTGISSLDSLQTQAKPLAKVGGNAALAVGVDGSIHALSAEKGTITVLRPEGAGFAKPVTTTLGFTSKSAQVTAVGTHWVVWDSGSGKLWSDALPEPQQLSVGGAQPGNPAYAALQQPGPDATTVLIQDESRLTQVPLTGDAPTSGGVKLSQGGAGRQLFLSQPVRLASCIHAAWAGPSNTYYGRNCGSPGDTDTADLGAMKKGVRTDGVKLRVNRGLIVLNDLDSGAVWDVDRDQVKIDNWDSVIPPPTTDDKNKKKDENLVDDEQSKTPPKAQNDVMQVRPGPHVHAARARQRLRLAGLHPRHLARRRGSGEHRRGRDERLGRRPDRAGHRAGGADVRHVLVRLHRQQRHDRQERPRHGQGHRQGRRPRGQHPPEAARRPGQARHVDLPGRRRQPRARRGRRRLARRRERPASRSPPATPSRRASTARAPSPSRPAARRASRSSTTSSTTAVGRPRRRR